MYVCTAQWRPPTTKSPSEKSLQGFFRPEGAYRRPQAPSNYEKFLRKVPPMTTVGRPPWVKWRPPSPCPLPPPSRFSKYATSDRLLGCNNSDCPIKGADADPRISCTYTYVDIGNPYSEFSLQHGLTGSGIFAPARETRSPSDMAKSA